MHVDFEEEEEKNGKMHVYFDEFLFKKLGNGFILNMNVIDILSKSFMSRNLICSLAYWLVRVDLVDFL